ncbi:formate-dependent nitrite reductase, periplasmic cytochrome c552 subunit [Candidatus Methanoperedens nitroreducens]|uniref:Formate-dependent nitrite reductase, periplasmic cytochrome c552 subunit n=1 Tax=Candidatus Methanoperedens nitratireducens TaxID=1392998 RepID=A0A062V1W9_9EURY|nr:ammonia-forming cytochrome c nitrite reductase subunit c552 [Candidatus Methanoperedens nitroreducens]KCZ70628.1 formate-dependent nitrite reductase, periplasmic cytochrome c552 subunit [Candidatus Methanoperedens nitroreducens]MDJ1420484.1 ammonia-forming cytochrome c nitrite reductase subunit c552 [Candidatus Methanoperedens sp.]
MKKGIMIGFGIIIVLLMLAGSTQATPAFYAVSPLPDCSYCHKSNLGLKPAGINFNTTHLFDGIELPESVASCTECHTRITLPSDFSLTSMGQSYNASHRYNDTTLASTRLAPPACANCHTNAIEANFNLLEGTPTYLTSTTCENCHKEKYDTWYNGTHRVKLVPASKAQDAGYPLPNDSYGSSLDYTWDDISYVIGGKWKIRYVNSTGYIITKDKAGTVNGSNQYNVLKNTWDNYEAGKDKPYDCGECHTTGYDLYGSIAGKPGIIGNWTETGVGCEACHGAAGNGHQVTRDDSAEVCGKCHSRSGTTAAGTPYDITDINPERKHHEQYNDFVNSPHNNTPQSNPYGRDTCQYCHSPFEYITKKLNSITVPLEEANGISCAVCHDPHDVSDDRYAAYDAPGAYNVNLFSDMLNITKVNTLSSGVAPFNMVKFVNTTASAEKGVLTWDSLDAPANRTVTETLCLTCHTRHGNNNIYDEKYGSGFIRRTGSGNSHAELKYPGFGRRPAGCVDCHMPYSSKSSNEWDIRSHTFVPDDGMEFEKGPVKNFPELTCGRGGQCHSGAKSLVPIYDGWASSLHNDKEIGNFNTKARPSSCSECHSPSNFDPADKSAQVPVDEFKGVTCAACHDIHNMGNWLKTYGVPYASYNAAAYTGMRSGAPYYYAGYDYVADTTELCGNCHTNKREGRSEPGWASATATTPISPHGFPAKDVFVSSWKQSSILMNFSCIDCHMATNDSNKGHSFKVNATLLQSNTECSSCHVTGTALGNISKTIENVQAKTHDKWNATNTTVQSALTTVNAYTGEKNLSRDKIAQAYWNLRLVYSDESWGAHNPTKVNELLDDAERLAGEAITTLGQKEVASTVQLKAGWNLVALNGTPAVTSAASVMSSVASNITIVWGYNAATASWELYDPDPAVPSSVNSLKNIVPGKGYWIRANVDVEWTA